MEGLNLFESNILLWIQENLRTDALDLAAVLIAVSRLYNAAHYLTDVLAGIFIGTLTGTFACKLISGYGLKRKLGD